MDSSINVRWKNGETAVECSHTGELWKTKVSDGETTVVVARRRSREEAVDAAVEIMNGRIDEARGSSDGEEDDKKENPDEVPGSEFEKEVESVLEDVDVESLEEVNEAFGD